MQIKLNKKIYDLSTPMIMGIVNVTPDSFYSGSRFTSDKSVLSAVEKMLYEGADIIDIGGYSTRPLAENITANDEMNRLGSALEIILHKFPDTLISVDTFRSNVARFAVSNFNVALINDIGGGTLDDLMFESIADLDVAYVLMHTKGTPQNMQSHANYEDVVSEVLFFLQKRIAQLHQFGVNDIIADPGFGFAKTMEQSYELLSKLSYFKALDVPIMAGLSRKSMIYKLLDIDPKEALNGTTAANMLALMGGASFLRVHDVNEAREAVHVFKKYQQGFTI